MKNYVSRQVARELKDDSFGFGVSNSMEFLTGGLLYITVHVGFCTTFSITCSGPEWKFHLWRWQRLELVHFGEQEGIKFPSLV